MKAYSKFIVIFFTAIGLLISPSYAQRGFTKKAIVVDSAKINWQYLSLEDTLYASYADGIKTGVKPASPEVTILIDIAKSQTPLSFPLEFKWFRYSGLKRFLRGVEHTNVGVQNTVNCTKSNISKGDWEVHVFDSNGHRIAFNDLPFMRLKVY